MIFWWFFDDFLGFVWFYLLKQNLQKSSNNYQKIIKKSSFCWKNHENPRFGKFSWFFQAKRCFFDDFLGFCLIFSFEAKPSNIIKKSTKKYHFFYHCFDHSEKNIIFLSFCLSSQDTSLHPTKISLSANHPGKRAEGDSPKVWTAQGCHVHGLWAHDAKTSRI